MAEEKVAPVTTTAPAGTAAPATTTATIGTTTTTDTTGGQRTGDAGSALGSTLPMIIGMILIFYFLIIRPEKKRQAQQKELLGTMKKNDRVILAGIGIYGTIADIDGDDVTLVIDPKKDVRIKVRKESIGGIVNEEKK